MLFQSWLRENIDCDEYRDRVRSVALGLGDLRACELEDLEEALDLASWPVLAKKRFLKAWRELKGEGAPAPSEEAPRPASPPSPGPRPAREPKKQKESQARHAFAVGDEVEALWDEKWWKAVVHDLRDDGSYEVHWDGMEVYDFVAANAVRAVPDAVRAVPWGAWGGLGRIFGK